MDTKNQNTAKAKIAKEDNIKHGVIWPTLKFPPINLYNMWPTKEMAAIHAETLDPALWYDYD